MRLFEADDYPIIKEWFEGHKMKAPPYSALPSIGIIEDMYAAGFLVQTDTPCAVIDFLISNPDAGPRKRNKAIDDVIQKLEECAKRHGFKYLKGDTQLKSVSKRAINHGFKSLSMFHAFLKEL